MTDQPTGANDPAQAAALPESNETAFPPSTEPDSPAMSPASEAAPPPAPPVTPTSLPMAPPASQQAYDQQQYAQQQYAQQRVYVATTPNGFAIGSIIAGFFVPPLGVVLGIIALTQIKKSNGAQSGRGLAIAGIAVGGFLSLALLPIFLLAISTISGGASAGLGAMTGL